MHASAVLALHLLPWVLSLLLQWRAGVALSSLVLIQERTVPKTTSGKIARAWARKAFLQRTLSVLGEYTAADTGGGAGQSSGAAAALSAGGVAAGVDHQEAAAVGRELNLSNEELMEALLEEAARLMECELEEVNAALPLIHLGMDSLSLAQLQGAIQVGVYGYARGCLGGRGQEGCKGRIACPGGEGGIRGLRYSSSLDFVVSPLAPLSHRDWKRRDV